MDEIKAFFKARAQTLDLLPDYWRALIARWNDIFWLSTPTFPLLIWWFFGSPPMSLVAGAFVWAFAAAGYYAWRDEYLKRTQHRFKTWIYSLGIEPGTNRLFVGVRITNVGVPTSIHTWQGGFRTSHGGRAFTDGVLVQGKFPPPIQDMRGENLKGDLHRYETGETREGWIAMDIGSESLSQADMRQLFDTASVQFTDAFGDFFEVQSSSSWMKKPER